MLVDFEIANCSRVCATTGRQLAPGEAFFSTLHLADGKTTRRDYSAAAWTASPADAIAWWRSRISEGEGAKLKLAPQDVLLNLFAELAEQPTEVEFRYVLGLLLVRRRLLKLVDERRDVEGEVLILDCPRRGEQFELRVAVPNEAETQELERRLVELLYGGE